MVKGPGKSSSNKIIIQDEQEMVLGKRNVKAACPKDRLEFKFLFLNPVIGHNITIINFLKKIRL